MLWGLLDTLYERVKWSWEERFERQYGFWRGLADEAVARYLDCGVSPRRDEALIHVTCAALPESIAESELFGHVPGAFTWATRDRPGKFEVADGGTLFLDEVGELPSPLQPKLLRALQNGEIQRVGSDRVRRVTVRVVAASNRDLERELENVVSRAVLRAAAGSRAAESSATGRGPEPRGSSGCIAATCTTSCGDSACASRAPCVRTRTRP